MTDTPDRIHTYVVTINANHAVVTDTDEQHYVALFNHRINPAGLRVGDCVTGVPRPSREGPLQILTAVARVPQLVELQYLPENVTATVFASYEKIAFARDEDGADFFVPRGGFTPGAVITGRPEAPHRGAGAVPVLIPMEAVNG